MGFSGVFRFFGVFKKKSTITITDFYKNFKKTDNTSVPVRRPD